MKYEIEDKVTRSVARLGMIMDPKTMNIARDEADDYDFRLISENHYAVQHGEKMYVIIERGGDIGCSCEDMSYNRTDGSCCKHIIAFSRLLTPIVKAIDEADRGFLMNACGWTGKELHPPAHTGPPPSPRDTIPADPDLDLGVDDPLPDPRVALYRHEQKPEEEKKMSEDKPAWNQKAWDGATQGSFATFDENGVAVILFTANDFEMGKSDKWGRATYEFAVIQNNTAVIFSVAAIRLMAALKTVLPLENKQMKITRVGEGMNTTYEVQDVTEPDAVIT